MKPDTRPSRQTRRIPAGSFFYERLMPLTIIALAVLLVGLIVIAAAFVLGVIHYQ